VATVLLHGNKIAEIGYTCMTLYDGGYQSATTKSRLNAILSAFGNGEYIFQKDFVWYLSTKCGNELFRSGMNLR
jgi:hypothetical protein